MMGGCESRACSATKSVVIAGLHLVSHVMGASASCSGTIWQCKYHTCVEAGICCCCTVALLGLAFALDGCNSREPFLTVEGRPLVLGLKDSVCIVLQSSKPGHQHCAYWQHRKSNLLLAATSKLCAVEWSQLLVEGPLRPTYPFTGQHTCVLS